MWNITLALLSLLLLALLASSFWISGRLLYPPRQGIIHTPADCGLVYEEITFQSTDGLALPGWWIPAAGAYKTESKGSAVILLHPMFGNRHGFSAGQQGWPRQSLMDVDLLKTARGFHQAGYTVLMFDFRSHGESPRSRCAGGLSEDQDVVGAVDYVFNRFAPADSGLHPPDVGLVGFGLGAAAAITAVGREKGGGEAIRVFSGDSEGGVGWAEIQPANIKRMRFLVVIQPASLGVLLRGFIRQVSTPLSWILVPLVDRACRLRGGYPLKNSFLIQFAREVNVPVLYVQARSDPWGDCEEVQALYDATRAPKEIRWLEHPLRRQETYNYIGDHLEDILAFTVQHWGKVPV